MSVTEGLGVLARINAIPKGYGGNCSAHTIDAVCDVCQERKKCVRIDLSGGEYHELDLCGGCLRKLAENVG